MKFIDKIKNTISGRIETADTPEENDNDSEELEKNSIVPDEKNHDKDNDPEADKEKGEEESDEDRDSPEAAEGDVKNLFNYLIKPEERTISNYLNPLFWITKNRKYRKIKQKEKDGLNTYAILSEGAKPSIEYYILTILSCIIATFGLIQGSSAIIIGAMIVAPLMTPILAFSLGVIWGDLKLIRFSLGSVIKGTLLAIIISAAIAYIVPISEYSGEILSRTVPSLFDILVAIASGIVGAYGYANKKISNTIIGIAIAVALMPPLCTIGIGLGTFNWKITSGSSILFAINLVSIALSGAIVFWMMRIHPIFADREKVARRAIWQILISIIILSGIAVPVGFFMYEHYQVGDAKSNAHKILKEEFPDFEIMSLDTVKTEKGIVIAITLSGEEIPDDPTVERMEKIKARFLKLHSNIAGVKVSFMQSHILLK